MAHRQIMSIEAAMDEERKEVLALLEGMATNRRRGSSTGDARSPSPYAVRSPVRSMLDIGSNGLAPVTAQSPQSLGFVPSAKKSPSATAPVRSMLDIDSPPKQTVRSMLDVDSPPPSAKSKTPSNPASPIEPNHRAPAARQATAHPRSMSDASASPADFGPRAPSARQDPTADFQFSGIITQGAGQSMPKRVSRGGKRQMVMSEALRGELPKLPASDRGSHYSIAGPTMPTISRTSKSPSSRIAVRSMSPHNLLPVRALSPGRRILQPEVPNETYDANAYRRLSDAHLARSLGSLSELTRRKKRENNAKSGRLTKDYLSPDGELLADSSDDNGSSSEEEGARGRQAARKFGSSGSSGSVNNSQAGSLSPDIHRKTSSLLWAAEEERLQVASNAKYRSLLDEPEITVTNPSGERVKQSKHSIHPNTSFDNPPGSGSLTPLTSDEEAEITDIRRAQKLSFSMTQIMTNAESHRSIQIITRGEWARIVQETEDEHRTPRKYLVATDMSEESTHALEWAIGTVLRDGDQLIAIDCVDEEGQIVSGDQTAVPDDPKAMKEQATAIQAVSTSKTPLTPGGTVMPLRPSPLNNMMDASGVSVSPAPSSRERSKAEEERYRAVRDISDRIMKLLRKTRLQVRVIVEVVHCRNPRHLITEVIDIVNPTLVILGSRGRSALKGVILGSFSNYLVTKSSVPVMVARKRLRKPSKYKPAAHQVNNISNPSARSLANAKID